MKVYTLDYPRDKFIEEVSQVMSSNYDLGYTLVEVVNYILSF